MARKDKNKEEIIEEQVVNNDEVTLEDDKVSEEVVKEPTVEEKYKDLNDKYLRLYSDFDNFRKRTIKEKADIISLATSDLMKELLPIVDDFERAISNNDKSEDLKGLKEGFDLIYNKLFNNLKSKGLEVVEAQGAPFDPEIHEAITNIPASSDDMKGKVMDVVEKGYNLKGRSLRYPKVVVGQ